MRTVITRRQLIAGLAAVALLLAPLAHAQTGLVVARHGMVVTQDAIATRIGVDILRKGGNAVDTAVAVAFAMAVTHPQAGNLGGGGFMLIHLAKSNQTVAIDYREIAPKAVTTKTFLDEHGEADPNKSRSSPLGIGVPGTVAGLALALDQYGSGKFTLAQLIAPALGLARDGFLVDSDLAQSLRQLRDRLLRWPASAQIFLKPDGSAPVAGDTLVQTDLARTLELIARDGPHAFYQGPIGEKIAASILRAGGVMTRDDLRAYKPVLRVPVFGTYRGFDVFSMPPPSSGGVHLIEMLNILEGDKLADLAPGPAAFRMVEAMKLAYADRATFLGDPEAVRVPVKQLTSKSYAAALRTTINPDRARPAADIKPGGGIIHEGQNTTHFSIVDADGNAVSNTYTLNFTFGLGMVADGTGILLNNELDDFAAKPGAPNAYGLIGFAANAPGPGKRPLSSMTPTIVLKDGKVMLVTGSPGGSRIITTVLQIVSNVVDRRMDIAQAVAAPRIHHQWMPDLVFTEPKVAPEVTDFLKARGETLKPTEPFGSANSILVTPDGLTGAADPRSPGALAAGY